MADLQNPLDALRLDYLAECADLIAARAVAIRMAAIAGDVATYDELFAMLRRIASDMVMTRKEIETIETADTDNRQEAA
jgi:hypothetical protein